MRHVKALYKRWQRDRATDEPKVVTKQNGSTCADKGKDDDTSIDDFARWSGCRVRGDVLGVED